MHVTYSLGTEYTLQISIVHAAYNYNKYLQMAVYNSAAFLNLHSINTLKQLNKFYKTYVCMSDDQNEKRKKTGR